MTVNAITYIGATIACSASVPATIDSVGFAALTYTAIGKIASWGETGDTSADVTVDLLEGRIEHATGSKDGGEIPFAFRTRVSDAGQAILIAQSNVNNDVSFRITDPDGKIAYLYGKVANVRDTERTSSTYKGMTGVVRVNSTTVRV